MTGPLLDELRDLLSQLLARSGDLLRAHLALLQRDFGDKTRIWTRHAISFAALAVAMVGAVGFFAAAGAASLAPWVPSLPARLVLAGLGFFAFSLLAVAVAAALTLRPSRARSAGPALAPPPLRPAAERNEAFPEPSRERRGDGGVP